MARGFLKTVGASKRLRFVKAGYDADNLNTHPNAVIFDSGDNGALSLVATGSYGFSGWRTPGNSFVQIASWSLQYVPLCMFQFDLPTIQGRVAVLPVNPGGASDGAGGILPYPSITVTNSGIFFRGSWTFDYAQFAFTIHYQAYRQGVT